MPNRMRRISLFLAAAMPFAAAAAPGDAQRNKGDSNQSCQLGNDAGRIQHVIQIQFDNTHLLRDRANVPSDLEHMPHLLDFIRQNGTLLPTITPC